MLDNETKRRIDTARDILVGKVPDPKSQVEQITIALIYKFMSDMDSESEELGGTRKFFTGEYEKYSWQKLMSPDMGGYDVLNLYSESIQKMNFNQNIPQLFRDIFKNAYLPYRDPETLKSFLKIINDFDYDHSEKLGDAFEYLLSVLGSQGDAGQFRTPRHIIEFMVNIIEPKKNETILDPACGTAGFLISSYKHIAEKNSKDGKNGANLTPDDRNKLAENIIGYDISPDMVRLSLVNMYLHGFRTPNIFEYDTLTSEDRWNEYFDIVLANPPFMSPKGGIKPHKRFSVQSNRSEVLFVDYIAEHLAPTGRAAVIVPEGIIFQSQNAYKQLRKMLIEKCLYAVVSLPAGVFNPYSGVKTSILLMDKNISKRTDKILFVKIENDGYDLGAQRREIKQNDIPQSLSAIKEYCNSIYSGNNFDTNIYSNLSFVEKTKIAEDGDFSLSGDRYKIQDKIISTYKIISLNKVATISAGNSAPQDNKYFENGEYPFFRTSDVGQLHISDNFYTSKDMVNDLAIKECNLRLFPQNTILFPKSGASTFLNHRVMMSCPGYVSSHLATIIPNEDVIIPKLLFHFLCFIDARNLTENQNYPSLRLKDIEGIKIPLPPLEIQKEIVTEIEELQEKIVEHKIQIDILKSKVNSVLKTLWKK
jgi:type I restriction enzyme M protein